jgi:hypothetical protein
MSIKPLALLAAAGLVFTGSASPADAAGTRARRAAPVADYGVPFGGYYRSVPLVRISRAWIHEGPPYGGYYRSVPLVRTSIWFGPGPHYRGY